MAVEAIASTTQATVRRARRKRTSRNNAQKAQKVQKANRPRVSYLRTAVARVLRQGKRTLDSANEWKGKTQAIMPRRFARIRLPHRSDFRAIAKTNPLVLGAVGIGIGIVLASVVPGRISARWRTRTSSGSQARQHGRRR